MSDDWSHNEVDLIVKDYFQMLLLDLSNEKYNKSIYRSSLKSLLNNRSDGSIEFKHQNISAVLARTGIPFINGYKPRFNYQKILEEAVYKYLLKNLNKLEKYFDLFSTQSHLNPNINKIDFEQMLDDEPNQSIVRESEPLFKLTKVNYLEKEQNNRDLGEKGESLIIDYEKWRLVKNGKDYLADKVEWVSKDSGDGAGFDILSKNNNGTDRFIEVKTTKLTKETPIFLSRNEVKFASLNSRDFYLYRVFNINTNPKFFIKTGEYEKYCTLIPLSFKGYF